MTDLLQFKMFASYISSCIPFIIMLTRQLKEMITLNVETNLSPLKNYSTNAEQTPTSHKANTLDQRGAFARLCVNAFTFKIRPLTLMYAAHLDVRPLPFQ